MDYCKICDGCESVDDSSSYDSSSEFDDEYWSRSDEDDHSERSIGSDSVSIYSVESEISCSSDYEPAPALQKRFADDDEKPDDDEKKEDDAIHIKLDYEGFDNYPAEIQGFIKKGILETRTDDKKNDHTPDDNLGGDDVENEEDVPHNRGKRSVGHYNPHPHHRGRRNHKKHDHHKKVHRRRYRKKRSSWRMAKVGCPTGKTFAITMPATEKSGWKCGKKSKLITLRKNGRMGRREYTIVSKEMEKTKQDHSSGVFSKYEIIKIQKIVNPCLWKRYRYRRRQIRVESSPNDRLLWHGSPHVAELVHTGFDERHANPSGMFGAGLYFASNSSKSNQYVFGLNGGNGCVTHKDKNCFVCERSLLLCRVALGKVQQHTTAHKYAHAPVGFHSVEGVPGASLKYAEYIVYRGEQVYPEFLITYKIVK